MTRIIILFLVSYCAIYVLPELAGHVSGTWLEDTYNDLWNSIAGLWL